MSALFDLMNQITATYLQRKTLPPGPFTPQRVQFTSDGMDISGALAHPQAQGPAALRLTVEERSPGQFVLHVAPIELPPQLAVDIAPYRDVLERLKVHVDLDFSGAPTAGIE